MPNRMPEDMPDRIPEDMPDRIPEGMPNRMPDKISDRLPQNIIERIPEDLPDNMPEDMPDKIPDRITKDIPTDMPEDMPGDMPEYMPGAAAVVPVLLPLLWPYFAAILEHNTRNRYVTFRAFPNRLRQRLCDGLRGYSCGAGKNVATLGRSNACGGRYANNV